MLEERRKGHRLEDTVHTAPGLFEGKFRNICRTQYHNPHLTPSEFERFLEITEYARLTSRQLYPDASRDRSQRDFPHAPGMVRGFLEPVVSASGSARRTFEHIMLSPSRLVRIGRVGLLRPFLSFHRFPPSWAVRGFEL